MLELSPSRFEFYIQTLPWFGLTRDVIDYMKSLEPEFVFQKTTYQFLEVKYENAPDFMKRTYTRYDNDVDYSSESESKYSGSYAQDVEGYSDDDIDDVFGGDPEAYWNVD
ncbi:MAG: hypothetical protein ACXVPM_20820 [Bacteroidia bacterium]